MHYKARQNFRFDSNSSNPGAIESTRSIFSGSSCWRFVETESMRLTVVGLDPGNLRPSVIEPGRCSDVRMEEKNAGVEKNSDWRP